MKAESRPVPLPRTPWTEPASCDLSTAILAACDGDAFLATILRRRGFNDPERIRGFFSPEAYSPAPPQQLPDLVAGSALLREAIAQHQRILIWGDFDVDGQTSTAVLIDGLQRLGADVSYYIPDRAAESHGIKVASLQQQIAAHKPGVLVTCDTGITEFEAMDYAKSIGLPLIITDHHELGDHLPEAAAVITPRRLPNSHPLTSLPGVGVAYKLMQHLYTALGHERDLPRLLDLVALGIVGDVAEQTDDTRYLLQLGLDRLRRTERIGLQALSEVAAFSPATMTGEKIAFQIAPRLNAAGRLANAALAVELLTTHQSARARVLAQQLEGLNIERRAQTRQMESAAEEMIAASPALLDSAALVLYQPEWNPGIIGIVAAHLAERYERPVVMLAGQDNGIARGSARGPRGFDINKALTAQADILRTFGGHPGAAGLSLEVQHIERFRQRFSKTLADSGLVGEVPLPIDAVVTFNDLTLDLAGRLQRLAPFGQGNPSVMLATLNVRLAHAAIVGRDQAHRRLTVEDSQGRQQVVLWWHSADDVLPDAPFDIAYNLSINERQELQLSLVNYRLRPEALIEVQNTPIDLIDWRQTPDPLARLEALIAKQPDAAIWAEAESRRDHPTWLRRAELAPADTLIVFTSPPDPQAWREVVERVRPHTIHVIAALSPINSLQSFLAQLMQAVQNVIDLHGGETALDVLCGATAGSPQAVRAGLDFLAAHGKIGAWSGKTKIRISTQAQPSSLTRDVVQARLEAATAEMDAYRRFFRSTPVDRLLT